MGQSAEGMPGLPPPVTAVQFTDEQQDRRRALIYDFATEQDIRVDEARITPAAVEEQFASFKVYFTAAQEAMRSSLKPGTLKVARILLSAIRVGQSPEITQNELNIEADEYGGHEHLLLGMLVRGKKIVEQQKLGADNEVTVRQDRPAPPAPPAKRRGRREPSHAWNGDGPKTKRQIGGLVGTAWTDDDSEPGSSRNGVAQPRQRSVPKQLSNAGLGPRITELFGADQDVVGMLRMYHGVDRERRRISEIAEEFDLPVEQVRAIIQEATPKLLGEDSSNS